MLDEIPKGANGSRKCELNFGELSFSSEGFGVGKEGRDLRVSLGGKGRELKPTSGTKTAASYAAVFQCHKHLRADNRPRVILALDSRCRSPPVHYSLSFLSIAFQLFLGNVRKCKNFMIISRFPVVDKLRGNHTY